MKSKASWFNGRLFVNTLFRYGFLAVINGIVFFFALPLAMLILLRRRTLQIAEHFERREDEQDEQKLRRNNRHSHHISPLDANGIISNQMNP